MQLYSTKINAMILRFCLAAVMVVALLLVLSQETRAAEVAGGSCGDNMTWVLDDTGTLTISGTGDMYDYSWSSAWYDHCNSIKSVVFANEVSYIGAYSFYDCTNLTSIELPKGVTEIGNCAFRDCASLTSIEIPEGVIRIGDCAFDSCTSLKSIVLPKGLNSISDSMFENCCTLTSIEIPTNVTSIGNNAFHSCISLRYIELPESVTSIGYAAFYKCTSLESIVLPKGMNSIGDYTFESCSTLTSIVIPEGVTSIGEEAFYGCSSLASIAIPDGVTSIDDKAFRNCTSLSSIVIPEGVTNISYSLFYDCRNLTSIVIPESVTSIGAYAFKGCNSLMNIVVPDDVTSIGYEAFYGCKSLTSIILPEGITNIGYGAFYQCSNLASITIPKGITSLDRWVLAHCSSLTSIEIPHSVTSIGEYAFCGCSSLTRIEIPSNVTSIGEFVFDGCSNLTGIYVHPDNEYFRNDGYGVLYSKDFSKLLAVPSTLSGSYSIHKDATAINRYSFFGCSSLTNIEIPKGVTSIPEMTFGECFSLTNIVIPDSVTSINQLAFYSCFKLTSIVIPESVTSIGYSSFMNCNSIQDIYYGGTTNNWTKLGANRPTAKYIHYSCTDPETHWQTVSVDPTCTEAGYTSEACSCGFQRNIKPYSALGHTEVIDEAVAPTCTETGLTEGKHCEVCEEVLIAQEEIPALGHDYDNGKCGNCGHLSYLANVVINRTVPHTTGIILYWDAVENSDIYQIYRLASGESSWTLIKNTRSLGYKDESAEVGIKYYYKIVARNGDVKSDIKTTASVSAVRPAANLANVVISKTVGHTTGNILYWDAVDGAKLYQVYRLDNGSWTLLKNTGSLAYKDETAPIGVKSYYKIVARNGDIKSDIATTASTGVVRPAAAVTKLDNVTITQIKPHSTGNILYWNAVENAKIYQVYRLENGSWVLLKNTGSLGYKDETAPVGVKCYYKIVARNGDVKSDIKTTASASATRP